MLQSLQLLLGGFRVIKQLKKEEYFEGFPSHPLLSAERVNFKAR